MSEPRCWTDDEAIPQYREFVSRRVGMIHAMDGGLWLHRHVWKGTPMAHLISTDRQQLLEYGRHVGLPAARLQFKLLKDPRTGMRRETWHWDLVGRFLPEPRDAASRSGRFDRLWIDPRG